MNANFRNFALWVIIGLVLIALFNLFQNSGQRSAGHDIAYSQCMSSKGNEVQAYQGPAPGYGSAPQGYGGPAPGYGQPPSGYGQPPPGYGGP